MANITFPEQHYPVDEQRATDYSRYVRRGYLNMRQHSIVICGLARNIEAFLANTMARLEFTGRLFKDYRIIVYENDSTDQTLPMLRQWAENNSKVHLITETLGMPVNPGTRDMARVDRMARYRNICRNYIVQHYADWPYTMVVDMDLPGGWSYDGLANSFGHNHWDFIGSNGLLDINPPRGRGNRRTVYYDAWAFRSFGRPEPHEAQEVNPMVFKRGQLLLPVFSCFGGLGLYTTQAMVKCEYRGGDCEHVPFHNQMRSLGMNRMFLNPSQIVLYGTRSW